MTKRSVYKSIYPAVGGLNTATNAAIVNEQQLVIANNIVLISDGSRTTRYGQARFSGQLNSATSVVTLIKDFFLSNGTQKTVVKSGTKYYADAAGDGTFVDITGSETISATAIVSTEVINNLLIICSSTEAPYKYSQTGNIAALTGSPPNGRYVRYHFGRMWIAGVTANPHRLYFSQAFNPEEWTVGAGYLDIDPDDGTKGGITAIFPSYRGELFVAKTSKLYKVTGSAPVTFKVEPVTTSVGCISHNSVVAVQNDIIFASERGIMSLETATNVRGDMSSSFLSADIHNQYHRIKKTRWENIVAVFVPQLNSYIFSCSIDSTTSNDYVYGLNIIFNQWYQWLSYTANSLAMIRDTSSRLRLMNGDSAGYVNRYNEYESTPYGDFGTTAIAYSIKTGAIYLNNKPHESWSYKGLWVTAQANKTVTVTVTSAIDNLDTQSTSFTLPVTGETLGSFVLGTSILGSATTLTPLYVPLEGIGHSIQLTMAISSSTARIQIFGYEIEAKPGSDSYEVRS